MNAELSSDSWKWVRAAQPLLVLLLSVIQGLVIYIYSGHLEDFDQHREIYSNHAEVYEMRLDALEIFRAQTVANRFTSQDAWQMNTNIMEAINDLKDELKTCIRTQNC